MPLYTYECRMCTQQFQLHLPDHARYTSAECPYCMTSGQETIAHPETGEEVSKLEIQIPRNITQKINSMDRAAREHGGVEQPGLGEGVVVRTADDFQEAAKRSREKTFQETQGEHSTIRPYKTDPDDPDSPVVMEKVTTTSEGFDTGEIVHVDHNPAQANESNVDKEIERLEKRVGPAHEGINR